MLISQRKWNSRSEGLQYLQIFVVWLYDETESEKFEKNLCADFPAMLSIMVEDNLIIIYFFIINMI